MKDQEKEAPVSGKIRWLGFAKRLQPSYRVRRTSRATCRGGCRTLRWEAVCQVRVSLACLEVLVPASRNTELMGSGQEFSSPVKRCMESTLSRAQTFALWWLDPFYSNNPTKHMLLQPPTAQPFLHAVSIHSTHRPTAAKCWGTSLLDTTRSERPLVELHGLRKSSPQKQAVPQPLLEHFFSPQGSGRLRKVKATDLERRGRRSAPTDQPALVSNIGSRQSQPSQWKRNSGLGIEACWA